GQPAPEDGEADGEDADGEPESGGPDDDRTAPEDLLGVEIEITPAGKDPKRLSLLSGGEKSMTALAFLFAVFLARPCPFYILDEVEAALDDLNIDRFLALLRRYGTRAQFIVVTHQKRTMEAADWLYGVSMGGDGVSKLVSRRLASVQLELGAQDGGEAPLAAAGAAEDVARDLAELFITREPIAAAAAADGGTVEPERERRPRLFRRLRESLRQTREALGSELSATLGESLDAQDWEALEEALIMADVGATTTAAVVAALEDDAREDGLAGEALRARLVELLAQVAHKGDDRIDLRARPTVILAVGVNGTGKTTTLGKLAWLLHHELGLTVLLGAADTFRAAATEQLEGWAERAGVEIVTGRPGSDPGAVAYEAVVQGRAREVDVVLIDTAGRLHTQDDLMAELTKIRRVIAKQLEGAPHETLLTIDATTGQNGLRQAKLFAEAVEVDGIVLTKLDGSAKGGVALAIARELGIPVKMIGVGETVEDLRPFDGPEFARALVG
ncbi:MAG: fused signal recognition particle receptor, partial [Solirubrobacteraceae bacterium]|nr:fused signal recognition particle receptor [Solirubrobacteraceae bacterium]